ncbi:MAG TPA: ABC transporter ATP-binding protein [Alphaproteobacteria bacterium]|nr:ABC transporter ATP-binding protein [Alphaproteobacteria bacterium]
MAGTVDESGLPRQAIEIYGLRKVYRQRNGRSVEALKGIDLAIPRGVIFGLLGPNGAGKSTLINILAGLARKTEGRVVVWGVDLDQDPRGVRASIGVVPQELIVDPFFTPREALDIQAGYYGVPRRMRRTEAVLQAVGLLDQAEADARSLSGGMRRRLLIAKALVHSPPIVILDEPTAGVDVELRDQLWAHVRSLNAEGATILLTTHYLEEAEALCEEIAIIDHGALIARDTTRALVERIDRKRLSITLGDDLAALPAALKGLGLSLETPRRLALTYHRRTLRIDAVLEAVRATGLVIADLSTEESDLEDVFRELTRSARPDAQSRRL